MLRGRRKPPQTAFDRFGEEEFDSWVDGLRGTILNGLKPPAPPLLELPQLSQAAIDTIKRLEARPPPEEGSEAEESDKGSESGRGSAYLSGDEQGKEAIRAPRGESEKLRIFKRRRQRESHDFGGSDGNEESGSGDHSDEAESLASSEEEALASPGHDARTKIAHRDNPQASATRSNFHSQDVDMDDLDEEDDFKEDDSFEEDDEIVEEDELEDHPEEYPALAIPSAGNDGGNRAETAFSIASISDSEDEGDDIGASQDPYAAGAPGAHTGNRRSAEEEEPEEDDEDEEEEDEEDEEEEEDENEDEEGNEEEDVELEEEPDEEEESLELPHDLDGKPAQTEELTEELRRNEGRRAIPGETEGENMNLARTGEFAEAPPPSTEELPQGGFLDTKASVATALSPGSADAHVSTASLSVPPVQSGLGHGRLGPHRSEAEGNSSASMEYITESESGSERSKDTDEQIRDGDSEFPEEEEDSDDAAESGSGSSGEGTHLSDEKEENAMQVQPGLKEPPSVPADLGPASTVLSAPAEAMPGQNKIPSEVESIERTSAATEMVALGGTASILRNGVAVSTEATAPITSRLTDSEAVPMITIEETTTAIQFALDPAILEADAYVDGSEGLPGITGVVLHAEEHFSTTAQVETAGVVASPSEPANGDTTSRTHSEALSITYPAVPTYSLEGPGESQVASSGNSLDEAEELDVDMRETDEQAPTLESILPTRSAPFDGFGDIDEGDGTGEVMPAPSAYISSALDSLETPPAAVDYIEVDDSDDADDRSESSGTTAEGDSDAEDSSHLEPSEDESDDQEVGDDDGAKVEAEEDQLASGPDEPETDRVQVMAEAPPPAITDTFEVGTPEADLDLGSSEGPVNGGGQPMQVGSRLTEAGGADLETPVAARVPPPEAVGNVAERNAVDATSSTPSPEDSTSSITPLMMTPHLNDLRDHLRAGMLGRRGKSSTQQRNTTVVDGVAEDRLIAPDIPSDSRASSPAEPAVAETSDPDSQIGTGVPLQSPDQMSVAIIGEGEGEVAKPESPAPPPAPTVASGDIQLAEASGHDAGQAGVLQDSANEETESGLQDLEPMISAGADLHVGLDLANAEDRAMREDDQGGAGLDGDKEDGMEIGQADVFGMQESRVRRDEMEALIEDDNDSQIDPEYEEQQGASDEEVQYDDVNERSGLASDIGPTGVDPGTPGSFEDRVYRSQIYMEPETAEEIAREIRGHDTSDLPTHEQLREEREYFDLSRADFQDVASEDEEGTIDSLDHESVTEGVEGVEETEESAATSDDDQDLEPDVVGNACAEGSSTPSSDPDVPAGLRRDSIKSPVHEHFAKAVPGHPQPQEELIQALQPAAISAMKAQIASSGPTARTDESSSAEEQHQVPLQKHSPESPSTSLDGSGSPAPSSRKGKGKAKGPEAPSATPSMVAPQVAVGESEACPITPPTMPHIDSTRHVHGERAALAPAPSVDLKDSPAAHTRSNCLYHKVRFGKGREQVMVLVPACALGTTEARDRVDAEDMGLASLAECRYGRVLQFLPGVTRLRIGAGRDGRSPAADAPEVFEHILRQLVGSDILREGECSLLTQEDTRHATEDPEEDGQEMTAGPSSSRRTSRGPASASFSSPSTMSKGKGRARSATPLNASPSMRTATDAEARKRKRDSSHGPSAIKEGTPEVDEHVSMSAPGSPNKRRALGQGSSPGPAKDTALESIAEADATGSTGDGDEAASSSAWASAEPPSDLATSETSGGRLLTPIVEVDPIEALDSRTQGSDSDAQEVLEASIDGEASPTVDPDDRQGQVVTFKAVDEQSESKDRSEMPAEDPIVEREDDDAMDVDEEDGPMPAASLAAPAPTGFLSKFKFW